MKTEHGAMHNQMNCWSSPAKSSPTANLSQQLYNQRLAPNQINQIDRSNQPIASQPNRVRSQINHQPSQINSSPRGSFSSDQSAVNLSSGNLSSANLSSANLSSMNFSAAYPTSDYSFSSTSSNNSSNTSSNRVTSTMNQVNQLVNQVTMVNAGNQTIAQPAIKQKQQLSIKSSVQLNQASTRMQNLPLCFNDRPTAVSKRKGAKQSNYKHVPHKDKPKHLVDKRNARERNRVKQVNDAFSMLRRYIPIENKSKRVSKVKTLKKAIDYIQNLVKMLNDSGTSDSALKLRNSLSLLAADEPTSTTSIDFKLDDEDTENSEPFFDNDFLDETSQQSSNNPISQFTNASTARYPSTNSVESNQSSDTNNNLIASNPQAQQLIDQHLSFNNSINFNNGQNYSIVSSISTGNQIPIQNLLIKENLLYQNVTSNCNAVYNAYAEFGN